MPTDRGRTRQEALPAAAAQGATFAGVEPAPPTGPAPPPVPPGRHGPG
ncbi:hypothetical protein [Streptomyces sp. NPDC006368]